MSAPRLDAAVAHAARQLAPRFRGTCRQSEPLAPHTSWRVGGPADLWLQPADETDLAAALQALGEADVPWVVLGRGSNALVADAGVRGAVISLDLGLSWIREPDGEPAGDLAGERQLECGAGTPVASLLRHAASRGLAGLELLTGVPGSVGGAVRMNAGTHLGELSDALEDARVMGPSGAIDVRAREALGLVYRGSALGPREIVVSARLRVRAEDPAALQARMQEVKERRRATQPLHLPSGGSTFANPPGDKAWRLIDAAGLRGARQGGARISEVHPNFIVNEGGATASDIAALIRLAQGEVQRQFGVSLRTEVCWVGAWEPREEASG